MYSRELLRLALRLAEQGRLADPQGSAERRSKACGSVVRADVRLDGDRVSAFGQEVRACAVGQASAGILGAHIVGLTADEIEQIRKELSQYFIGLGKIPKIWSEFVLMAPVREHAGRHAAALLPYDAALAAIDQALSASRNAATSAS